MTKRDFTERYAAGEFGNASPTWHKLEDFVASDWFNRPDQLFHLRNRVAGGETFYNQDSVMIEALWGKAKDPGSFYCSAMAPTELTLFQGEIVERPGGFHLHYSTVRKPMRDALAERSRHVSGLLALQLCQHYLCPKSYAWLRQLLNDYPDHTVEFSTYGKEWGTINGYNTVFWEVRFY